jgi:hypothetical protein
MFAPNGILALLILAAAPSAPADQPSASGDATEVQLGVHQEDASPETTSTYYTSSSEGWGPEAGTAYAGDSDPPVRPTSLEGASPFQEEPFPLPPGEAPSPDEPTPADLQGASPPGELPPDAVGAADAEPLTKAPWEDPSQEEYQDGGGWPEDAEYGPVYPYPGSTGHGSGRGFWGIGLEGWISQGLTINTDSPANRSNFPVTFNDRSNDYQLNQIYLSLARAVGEEGWHWDVGGRVDLLYGTDSFYTTARGLETHGDLSPKWNSQRYGLAMPQAYMEVYAPWGNGLTMKLGHFYSILGYETVPAAENFFYSKSFALQYGEPFTHTGFLGSTRLGTLDVHAGMTRGWDNWEDNNNDFAFLGGIDWTSPDERTSIAFAIHVGREQNEPPPNTNLRTLYSLVVQHWLSQRLQYAIQYDHGFDKGGGAYGRDADWFGLNQCFYYTLNPSWRAGVRCEWFRDEDAARIDRNTGADYFELSLGLNWMPAEWLTFRPEVRWDWANPLGGGSLPPNYRDDQILVAFDVMIRL